MTAKAIKLENLPHYTYSDYQQWEGRWELIGGIPHSMTPMPVIEHQEICGNLYWHLKWQLKSCKHCKVLLPVDYQVSEDTIVQPDILVVCGEGIGGTKLEKTPVIVFEVLSPSTAQKDKGVKYQIYEKAGVKYYCILEPETRSVEIFVLKKDEYTHSQDFDGLHMPFDLGPCQIQLNIKEIFE